MLQYRELTYSVSVHLISERSTSYIYHWSSSEFHCFILARNWHCLLFPSRLRQARDLWQDTVCVHTAVWSSSLPGLKRPQRGNTYFPIQQECNTAVPRSSSILNFYRITYTFHVFPSFLECVSTRPDSSTRCTKVAHLSVGHQRDTCQLNEDFTEKCKQGCRVKLRQRKVCANGIFHVSTFWVAYVWATGHRANILS